MKLDDIPTAKEMGAKLDSLSRLLFREKLIPSRSKHVSFLNLMVV
jgi:hypothetical protein